MVSDVPPDVPETPIRRLIREVKEANGNWSYRTIARNAGLDPDGKPAIHHNTVRKIATEPLDGAPTNKTIAALAAGLRVPIGAVHVAVAQTLGWFDEVPGQRGYSLAYALAARVDGLKDADERGLILGVLERLVSAAEAKAAASDEPLDEILRRQGEKAARLVKLLGQASPDDLDDALRIFDRPRDGATTERD